jgi:hypothetical protein
MSDRVIDVTAPPSQLTACIGNDSTDNSHAINDIIKHAQEKGIGSIYFPKGTYRFSETISIPANTKIFGDGKMATYLKCTTNNIRFIECLKNNFIIRDLNIACAVDAISGSRGIYTYCIPGGSSEYAQDFSLENILVQNFYNNIYIENSFNGFLYNVISTNANDNGIVGRHAQGKWSHVSSLSSKKNGFYFEKTTDGTGTSPMMDNIETFANGQRGIYANGLGIQLVNFFINNDSKGGIYITNSLSQSGYICNGNIQFCGDNPFANNDPAYANNLAAPGIQVTSLSGALVVSDVLTWANRGNDIEAANEFLTLANNMFMGSGVGGQSGSTYSVHSSGSSLKMFGNQCNRPILIGGNTLHIIGNQFAVADANLPAFRLAKPSLYTILNDNLFYNSQAGGAVTLDNGTATLRGNNIAMAGTVTTTGSGIYSGGQVV